MATEPTVRTINVVRSNIGALARLVTFDLRNGRVDSAVSLITKAAIAEAFKWRPIDGLPLNMSVMHTDMFIKSAALTLVTNAQAGWEPARVRRAAIILGTARALVTELYSVTVGELIAGETVPWAVRYVPASATNPEPSWACRDDLPADQVALLEGDYNITPLERDAMADIVMCAIGLPAVQGASLMATGHHYLSDVRDRSRAMFDVIEKQFWKKEPIKTWITEEKDIIQDILWHKACHPVSISLKMKLAASPAIAEKIRLAGAGSAASRLPAKEPVLKAAETTRTLMVNVRPFFESFGGVLDCELINEAIDVALAYVPGGTTQGGAAEIMPDVDMAALKGPEFPTWVNNRAKAITYLDQILTRNADSIAMTYGFYEALAETSLLGATTTEAQTLGSAFSLRKLRTQCFASYTLGRESHADYRAFKAQKRAAGEYKPPQAILR